VDVSQLGPPPRDLVVDVQERLVRVVLEHVLESTPRGESDRGAFLSVHGDDGLDGAQGETTAVLRGTAVRVGPLVADGLEELVDEVAGWETRQARGAGLVDSFLPRRAVK
jgi:hypothetical protein